MSAGQIIFLNGASSSGKTAIARALQVTLEEPYLLIGVDNAFRMLPERFRDWENSDNHQIIYQAISGLNRCIATLASVGSNIIVDHVILGGFKGYYLAECAFLLAHYKVFFVGVVYDLEELERRERQRRDRPSGLARAQFESVHAHGIYDLEVDSSQLSPRQCAELIKGRLRSGAEPEAFRRIRDRFISGNGGIGICYT